MKNIDLHLMDRLELSTYEELVFDVRFPTYNTMVLINNIRRLECLFYE